MDETCRQQPATPLVGYYSHTPHFHHSIKGERPSKSPPYDATSLATVTGLMSALGICEDSINEQIP
jgi:hypothetical protein